ncbi:hypothetical protein GGF44_002001 [Coemansia sp. RSA 1694]|nr:hypothetical protein GGF44_002001 [Coemansia sp. RSA 1694]
MEATGSVVASADPYADRCLVDEATHRSLVLCKAILSGTAVDPGTRIGCLAKCVSLLDALPKVRAFDTQAAREYKEKQKKAPPTGIIVDAAVPKSPPSSENAKLKPNDVCAWPLELLQILLDRALTLKDLAAAYCQGGNAQSSAYNYDRTVTLLEHFVCALPSFPLADDALAQLQQKCDIRALATGALLQALDDWADVEQALGRNAKAAKIRMRTDKWQRVQ